MSYELNGGKAIHKSLLASPPVLLAAGAPLALTTLCTSDLTSLGRATYLQLSGHAKEQWVGGALLLLLIGYLLDMHWWEASFHRAARLYIGSAGLCLLLGVLFHAEVVPSIPIIVGLASTLTCLLLLRQTVMASCAADHFMWAVGGAFIFFAALLTGVWLLWALTPHLGGYNYWSPHDELGDLGNDMRVLTRFLLWCSPLILAFSSLLIALLAVLRGRIHASAADGDESGFVARELRVLLACFSLSVMVAWVSAALAAADLGLSVTVLRLGASFGIFIAVYISYVLGQERLARAAERSNTVRLLLPLVHSDWCKAIFLVFAGPLMPIYFALEVVHQLIRGVCQQGLHGGPDRRLITAEAMERWESLQHWNRSSILTKMMWFGLLYFMLQVGISRGLTLFLAWLSERLATWPLEGIVCLLFIIGMVMFLLPPVPGTPIYLIVGIVVAQRCKDEGRSFLFGCSISVVFAFLLKFAAILMQQKAIGEAFSSSIQVKKMVAIHTPAMKAVKHILKQPGLSLGKVAVLVGGPDWPTSVLTGLYRLRAAEMLLGSTPLIFVITPICLAGAFTVKAGQDKANAVQYQSVANVMIMLSSVVLLSSMLIAGYYIETVQEEFKAEIERGEWENDPQEREVILALERDEEEGKIVAEVECWHRLPMWLKSSLYLGASLTSAMMNVVLLQVAKPFESFTLSSHIADLPGGTVWGIVRPSGWLCLACCAVSSMILASFYAWRTYTASAWKSGELRPLYHY